MKRLMLILASLLIAAPCVAGTPDWDRDGSWWVLTVTSDTLASGGLDTTVTQVPSDVEWFADNVTNGAFLPFTVFPISASTDTFSVLFEMSADGTTWTLLLGTQTYPPIDEEIFRTMTRRVRMRVLNADASAFPLNFQLLFRRER